MMHLKRPPAGWCINTLATRISKPRMPVGIQSLGFLIFMVCYMGAIMRRNRTGRKLPEEQLRRSDMTETDRTASVRGAIQGSRRRALPDMVNSRINLKRGG